ncbi:NAD-dependent epimerase/dehydratase family protein [Amylibacter sp.]|nr:NAD-dependent epimerase/dehydratase family protein [Amylibacter sp.]
MNVKYEKIALVTGSAGFIGYHVSKRLLDEGWRVIGIDCFSDYYDISIKINREAMLQKYPAYRFINEKIEKKDVLMQLFAEEKPEIVIHLAAQAGVRYSITNPRSYLESNLIGFFELLEAVRAYPVEHMLAASTSSVYGANLNMPYKETDKTDNQISFYAATKKSNEMMAHSYSHLFNIPITMFRFFTVYGPWGRPDMAYSIFTKAILSGQKIQVFNEGKMKRDFTYIDDLVSSIFKLSSSIPGVGGSVQKLIGDSLSPVAPFRLVNIGSNRPVSLMQFINTLEMLLGKKANKKLEPMQSGDVKATWASNELLYQLTAYRPETTIDAGLRAYVDWFRSSERK